MRFRIVWAALAALALSPAGVIAQAPAVASQQPTVVEGTLTFGNSAPIPLTFASAREMRRSLVAPLTPGRPVHLLLTDRLPTGGEASSLRAYNAAAAAGSIRGLFITIEPAINGSHVSIRTPGALIDDGIPGMQDHLELTDYQHSPGWISGRLRTTTPGRLIPTEGGPERQLTYRIDVRFRVPVTPFPEPTETITGAAVRQSPQAVAALAAIRAVQTDDQAAMRRLYVFDVPIEQGLASPEFQRGLRMTREQAIDLNEFAGFFRQIVVYGDFALILSDSDDFGIALRRVDGSWRVAPDYDPAD